MYEHARYSMSYPDLSHVNQDKPLAAAVPRPVAKIERLRSSEIWDMPLMLTLPLRFQPEL